MKRALAIVLLTLWPLVGAAPPRSCSVAGAHGCVSAIQSVERTGQICRGGTLRSTGSGTGGTRIRTGTAGSSPPRVNQPNQPAPIAAAMIIAHPMIRAFLTPEDIADFLAERSRITAGTAGSIRSGVVRACPQLGLSRRYTPGVLCLSRRRVSTGDPNRRGRPTARLFVYLRVRDGKEAL